MHNDYADRKNGRQPVELLHPDAAEILGDTYGLMIYQESMMRVAQKFAGYSLEDADNLRKACGKKIREVMAEQKEKFVAGCDTTGYGTDLYGEIEVSAWECRRGLRSLGLYVASLVAGFALLGFLIAPRRTWRAWTRGSGRGILADAGPGGHRAVFAVAARRAVAPSASACSASPRRATRCPPSSPSSRTSASTSLSNSRSNAAASSGQMAAISS